MTLTFLWGVIFLLLAAFLIPTGVLMKKTDYTQTTGTATGDCDIEKRKNSTTIRCDVRYAVNGIPHTTTIITPQEYKEGEQVALHVDTKHPSIALLDDPQKSSTWYIAAGVIALLIFIASVYGAWNYPKFFCFWGFLRLFRPR